MATAEPVSGTRDSIAGLFARRVVFVLAVIAATLLAWRLAIVFLLLFGAVVVATVLRALAAPLANRLRLGEMSSVAVALLATLILAGGLAWLVGDLVSEQGEELRRQLPDAVAAVEGWLGQSAAGRSIIELLEGAREGGLHWTRVADAATVTARGVGMLLLMVIIGIYLAFDPDQYRRGFVRLMPPRYRRPIGEALLASGHALSRWLLGQGVSMLFIGSATAIGLSVIGIPFALTLGFVAGLLSFVPFFGPLVAGVLAVLVAFLEGPGPALWVTALMVVIQQIEGMVLMPLVQRWVVSLPPVLAITASVIFGLLFGIIGIIFATPLMVVVMVLVRKLYIEDFLEGAPSAVPGAGLR